MMNSGMRCHNQIDLLRKGSKSSSPSESLKAIALEVRLAAMTDLVSE